MKHLLSWLLVVCMLFTFCAAANAETGVLTAEGAAQGFGGVVSVKLTVTDGAITEVVINGENETPTIGGKAIETMSAAMSATGSIDVDGVTGATVTSKAVLLAAQNAYNQIMGVQQSNVTMTAGTYTATANSYGGLLTLTVTVSENAITGIEVVENFDTFAIGSIAIDTLPEEIIANQSTGVDTVTGASLTTNAIKSAVRDCLTQAGATTAQFSTPVVHEKNAEPKVLHTDIVVVGSGLSGTTAAMRAIELGANVIMLEKLSITGGSAKNSLGTFMICEVDENEGYHLTEEEDTLDAAVTRWMEYQSVSYRESIYPDIDRLKFQLVQSMFTINWLVEQGATVIPYQGIADRGMAMVRLDVESIPEGTRAGKLLTLLRDKCIDQGMELYTDTRATELIVENGKVVGVRAETKTGELDVYADSVILSTGGYSENPDLLNRLIPELPEVSSYASVGNTGDGLLMAEAIGAALYEDQWIHNGRPRCSALMHSQSMYCDIFMQDASPIEGLDETTYRRLVVDSDGNRFMNEAQAYSSQDMAMFKLNNAPYWCLYTDLSEKAAEIAEQGIDCGEVIKGDSIREVAEKAGMNVDTFEATVNRYKEIVAAGEDIDFGKKAEYLIPISEAGPYYLVRILPGCCDTLGGVVTDANQHVLREDGSIIEGLYATGAMTNGVYYNQYYFSGTQLTFGATSGKIAGEQAANALNK